MLESVSREKTPGMVSRLLLDRVSDVNAVNSKGRSAFMETALWGRLNNAKILMNQGANTSLRDCRNRATDLAQPTQNNQRESLEAHHRRR
jgi:ankyrin repeat protein